MLKRKLGMLHGEGKSANLQNPRWISKYLIHVRCVNIRWSSLSLLSWSRTARAFGLHVLRLCADLSISREFYTPDLPLERSRDVRK
jgi:hypothetical protein